MNCKPDDIAVVVRPLYRRSMCGSGSVVVVKPGTHVTVKTFDGVYWSIEEPLPLDARWSCGCFMLGTIRWLPDSALRPIRPTNGEDETLSWKCGKPPAIEPVAHPKPQVEFSR